MTAAEANKAKAVKEEATRDGGKRRKTKGERTGMEGRKEGGSVRLGDSPARNEKCRWMYAG